MYFQPRRIDLRQSMSLTSSGRSSGVASGGGPSSSRALRSGLQRFHRFFHQNDPTGSQG